MPDFDRARLLHYCRMLDDADMGRRAAAALGVARFVKQHSLNWDDLIVKGEKVAGHVVPPAQTFPHTKFVTDLLADATIKMSDWDRGFCENMKDWQRAPTEKQRVVLDRLEEKYCSHVIRPAARSQGGWAGQNPLRPGDINQQSIQQTDAAIAAAFRP